MLCSCYRNINSSGAGVTFTTRSKIHFWTSWYKKVKLWSQVLAWRLRFGHDIRDSSRNKHTVIGSQSDNYLIKNAGRHVSPISKKKKRKKIQWFDSMPSLTFCGLKEDQFLVFIYFLLKCGYSMLIRIMIFLGFCNYFGFTCRLSSHHYDDLHFCIEIA